LPKARAFEKSIGAFNGWGGLVYLFTHLGALWNDRELLNEAESLIAAIEPLIDADRELDIIGGSAGCLVTLLQLHEITGSAAALEAATRCGERLRARAEAQPIGIGWMGNVPGPKPLAGFSHGTSGIAWALLKLSAATGRPQYRRMAHEALTYERTLFSEEHGNWKDIRETSREREAAQHGQRRPKFQIAWCHGAPGIAISRLLMREQLDDDVTRTELSVALETTVRHGLEGSQCLCHGAFGNVDALLLARDVPTVRYDTIAGNARMKRVLEEVATHGPRCANPAGIESPGLMTGLAGIGYGLLRLASPDTVPSILALAAPTRKSRA
jgi:class II lanthipeptide synthase